MKKSLFVISEKKRKKKKNELIASELNSFEKVRMRIYVCRRIKEGSKNIDFRQEVMKFVKKGSDFSWEVLKFMKKGSDFSREVLKFTKKGSQKTKCFGHGRRKMFVLRCVFEGGFQNACKLQ